MSRRSASGRVLAALLRLFPAWFRREYGDEMLSAHEQGLERARRASGRLGAIGFVLRSWTEVPGSAVRVRQGLAPAGSPDASGGGWTDDLIGAAKSLLRAPGWTATALLILTLGIGGTTAVFSVLNAVLLRPLPYAEPDGLVSLWTVNQTQNLRDGSSYDNARDWVERSRSLEAAALVVRPEFTTFTLTSFGAPERIHVGLVTSGFFELLGVRPTLGRVFTEADLDADDDVAVIAEALWTDRYARSPEVLGQTLTANGDRLVIVGVVPDELAIPLRETQVWALHDARPTPDWTLSRGYDAYWVIGRLADGSEEAEAAAELDRIAADLAVEYPETNANRGVRVRSLRAEIVGEQVPLLLWTLFGSMVLVLLVGGTNVAQLMMSRGIERRQEMAVRASLGASRARINRQLILESLLLSVCAGLGGVLLAQIGLRGLVSLIPPDVPLTDGVRIDGAVLLLGIGMAGVVAPLVGLLPTLGTARSNAAQVLRSGGRGSTSGERRVRSALVVVEVATAVVLLAGSGLLVRSARELAGVDPGFDARGTLIARVDLPAVEGDGGGARQQAVRDAVQGLAGVEAASVITSFFITRIPDQSIRIVGDAPRPPDEPAPRLTSDLVLPGFFAGLDVPLLRGRALTPADLGADDGVVLVNREWVETFAEGREPVGLEFRWGDRVEGETMRVVGVVGDLRRTTLDEASYPQLFMPGWSRGFDLLVTPRDGDPIGAADAVRTAIRALEPLAAVSRVGTPWERYGVGMAPRRFQTFMFTVFAALATMLAAIGLFAILHEAVAARRREIGIRLALGAAPSGVRRLVLRNGMRLAVAGLALGLLVTVALSGLLERLVYGIRGNDPLTLTVVSVSVLLVAVAASLVPALAATRVSPAETLAGE